MTKLLPSKLLTSKILREVKSGITIHRLHGFRSLILKRNYNVDVYLPPDYDASGSGPFPLLFFNDGQDMQQVKLTDTLHQLYLKEKIPSLIVVAIHAAERLKDYGTASRPDYRKRGNRAREYAHFVTRELKPFIRNSYPCALSIDQVAFAGFSLGGLSAMDIVWNHAHLFGKVGVFSGAFWWRHSHFITSDPDANRIMHEDLSNGRFQTGLKFWFQAGTMDEKDDRNNNGIIDAIDDTLDIISILRDLGYSDKDIHYREVKNGIHHPSTWAKVLPEFMQWAFRR